MGSRALCGRWFAMSGLEASMKLKILAIVALGVVGIGAAFVALGGLPASASATTQYLTGAVTTGDVSDDVAATGTMATTDSYGAVVRLAGPSRQRGGQLQQRDVPDDLDGHGRQGRRRRNGQGRRGPGDRVDDGPRTRPRDRQERPEHRHDPAGDRQDNSDAATTTAQIRQATIGVNNAQTQVTDAHKTVNDLLDQISLATLKSPIDGIVTTVSVSPGLSAPTGDAIVIDSTALQVTADVAETDVASISVGQLATVSVSAVSAQLTGKVTAIAPTAAAATSNGSVVSYPVTISVTGAPKTVRAGMTASITITIDSATNVLTVPSAALRGTAGNYSVLIMNATGEPTAQAVQVGLVTNTTAEIKSGLTEGQRVVTGVNTARPARRRPATASVAGSVAGSRSVAAATAAGSGTDRGRVDHLARPRQPHLRHGPHAGAGPDGRQPRGPTRGIRRDRRAVRLGQDDDDEHPGLSRSTDRRTLSAGRERPAVGRSRQPRMFIMVVLPEPDGPTIATIRPIGPQANVHQGRHLHVAHVVGAADVVERDDRLGHGQFPIPRRLPPPPT